MKSHYLWLLLTMLVLGTHCLHLQFWIDERCGSDTSPGNTTQAAWQSFLPAQAVLEQLSFADVTIFVSPGSYNISHLHWSSFTSLSIEQCLDLCATCSPSSPAAQRAVIIHLLPEDASLGQNPPLLQESPFLLREFAPAPTHFGLSNITFVSDGSVFDTHLISLEKSTAAFYDIVFLNLTLSAGHTLVHMRVGNEYSFVNCLWRDNRVLPPASTAPPSIPMMLYPDTWPQPMTIVMEENRFENNVVWNTSLLEPLYFSNYYLVNATFVGNRILVPTSDQDVPAGVLSLHTLALPRSAIATVLVLGCNFTNNLALLWDDHSTSTIEALATEARPQWVPGQAPKFALALGGFGGAIAASLSPTSRVMVKKTLFWRNGAKEAGAIYVKSDMGEMIIDSCSFVENMAHSDVVAAQISILVLTLKNSWLESNYRLESNGRATNDTYDPLLDMAIPQVAMNFQFSRLTTLDNVTVSQGSSHDRLAHGFRISAITPSLLHVTFVNLSVNPLASKLLDIQLQGTIPQHPQVDVLSLLFDSIIVREFDASVLQSFVTVQHQISSAPYTMQLKDLTFSNIQAQDGFYAPQAMNLRGGQLFMSGVSVDRYATSLEGTTRILISSIEAESIYVENLSVKDSEGALHFARFGNATVRAVTIDNLTISDADFLHMKEFNNAYLDRIHATHIAGGSIIRADDGLNLVVMHSSFANNTQIMDSGSALHVSDITQMSIQNCSFVGNKATTGGAVFAWSAGQLAIRDSHFRGNAASTAGGALHFYGAEINLIGVNATSNTATYGGAMRIQASLVNIRDSHFSDNAARLNQGGALFLAPSNHSDVIIPPPRLPTAIAVTLVNSSFFGNIAQQGGAIAITPSTLTWRAPGVSRFSLNVTMDGVRAINNYGCSRSKKHCAIRKSTIPILRENVKEGIPSSLDDLPVGGFLFSPYPDQLIINNSRFDRNMADFGGALFMGSFPNEFHSRNFSLSNSVFFGNWADFSGGAILMKLSTGIWDEPYTYERFSGVTGVANRASFGGFIAFIDGASLAFSGEFASSFNLFTTRGSNQSTPINSFELNRAQMGGVICRLYSSQFPSQLDQSTLDIADQSFVGNLATVGGIIFYQSIRIQAHGRVTDRNACVGNYATGFGPIQATAHTQLSFDSNFSTPLTQIQHEFHGKRFDDFGQVYADGRAHDVHIVPNLTHAGVSPYASSSFIDAQGRITLNVFLWSRTTTNSKPAGVKLTLAIPNDVAHSVDVTLIGCPPGLHVEDSKGCVPCPLNSYPVSGECRPCSESNIACHNGKISSLSGYYLINDVNRTSFTSVACRGRCMGDNTCKKTWKGPYCAQCENGLHQSILISCIVCDGPNWPMISIAIIILWLATILLHFLVAKSSGKATILTTFGITAFAISRYLPLSEMISSGTGSDEGFASKLRFFLCLWPMDGITRSFTLAMLPFGMSFLLLLTFAIQRVGKALYVKLRSCRNIPPQHVKRMSLEKRRKNKLEANLVINADPDSLDALLADNDRLDDSMDLSGSEIDSSLPDGLEQPPYMDDWVVTKGEDDGGFPADLDYAPLSMYGSTSTIAGLMLSPSQIEEKSFAQLLEFHYRSQFWHHHRLIRTLVNLLALSYSSVLGFLFKLVSCDSIPLLHASVLSADQAIDCHSSYYQRWRLALFAIIPYLVVVICFIAFQLIYGRYKDRLNARDVRFGVLYEMYKPRWFFMKLVDIARKTIFDLPLIYDRSDVLSSGNTMSFILASALALQLIAQPYASTLENVLASSSALVLVILSLLITWNPHGSSSVAFGLTIAFIVVISLMAAAILLAFGTVTVQKVLKPWFTRHDAQLMKVLPTRPEDDSSMTEDSQGE